MKAPFGNIISVEWDESLMTETLTDPYGRQTVIHYVQAASNDVYQTLVDHVDVPAFAAIPGQAATTFATYAFHYDYPRVATSYLPGNFCTNAHFVVPVLTSIDLPDGSHFVMSHYPNNVELTALTLPTQGSISWVIGGGWQVPGDTCKPVAQSPQFGVGSRIFHDPLTGRTETWTYENVLDSSPYDNNYDCQPNPGEVLQTPVEQMHTIVTSPKGDKTVHYFSAFRGLFPPAGLSQNGFDSLEFGLPLTHLEPRAGLDPALKLLLSTREYDCKNTTCGDTPDRTTYVQYEMHQTNDYSTDVAEDALPKITRTYFENDAPAGTIYRETAGDDYDGYGHYRKMTTSGNFGPGGLVQSRTVTTNYNGVEDEVGLPPTDLMTVSEGQVKPGSGTWAPNFPFYPDYEPWILGTYTSITRDDGSGSGKSKQLFFFNRKDGFLKRTRVRRGTDNGAGVFVDSGSDTHDLITAFEKTAATEDPDQVGHWLLQPAGEVASETRYGGDASPLASCSGACTGSNALQTFPLGSGSARNLTYAYGTLATDAFAEGSFRTLNATIERNTGAPRIFTDPAGHVRTMAYDTMGRIVNEGLPSGLVMKYVYSNAGAGTHASASASAYAPSDLLTPLTQTTYEFDGFGRVDSVRQLMPDPSSQAGDVTTHRETVWNTLGQKLSETEPALTNQAGVTTFYAYDAFGRVTSVIPPDGAAHAVSNTYGGERTTTTTVGAVTAGGTGGIGSDLAGGNVVEHPVTKTVQHDAFGRLASVVETSQNAGSPTTTTYDYDVLDHVARVTMTAPEGTQVRTFTFDNRGFLTKDSQPESGLTTYDKYDAYGHALHKLQGALDGPFDLSFVYDVYQRLVMIRQGTSFPTLIKQMVYDTTPPSAPWAPYSENGQLVATYRRNYHTELGGDVAVNSYFHYDTAGRLDSKATTVGNGPTFTQSYGYDVLSERTSLHYPNCSACTPIAGSATIPDRTIDFRWSHGYLTGVDQGSSHFTGTARIGYWPNGMLQNLTHVSAAGTNLVTDSQTLDQGMARPGTITFTGVGSCPSPTLTVASSVCASSAGNSASVSATGATGYTWTLSAGTITAGWGTSQITFTAPATGPFSVSVSVTGSCPSNASQNVTVLNGTPPTLTVASSVCASSAGNVASVSATGATGYAWMLSGGTITAGQGTSQITFTAPSTGPFSVSVSLTGGCASSASQNVTVNGSPALTVASSVCASSAGNAASVSATGATGYAWTLSAGTIAAGQGTSQITFTAPATGPFSVSVSVTGSCPSSASRNVTVLNGPTAQVSGSTTIGPTGSALIRADLTGTAPWNVTWSDEVVQSGVTSSPALRTVTPASTTTYTVTSLTDASACPTGSSSGSAVITVAPAAPASINATSQADLNIGPAAFTKVSIGWTAVSGAASYSVERSTTLNGTFTVAGSPATNSLIDVPPNSGSIPAAYVYRVWAVSSTGVRSLTASPKTFATVGNPLFSDEPVQGNSTSARGVHVSEVRRAIDEVRRAAGLSVWWGTYTPLTGIIIANDIASLRVPLDQACAQIRGVACSYSVSAPTSGAPIRAIDVQTVRDAVK
jgi:YD repeat-containing protein